MDLLINQLRSNFKDIEMVYKKMESENETQLTRQVIVVPLLDYLFIFY